MNRIIKVFNPMQWDGDSRWIDNSEVTHDFDKADLVLISGGSDIATSYYAQKANSYVHCSQPSARDEKEVFFVKQAFKRGIPCFGLCRGFQLLGALNGATLIQHLSHPSYHLLHLEDGSTLQTNSLHHQLVNPWNLSEKECKIIAWALEESDKHLGEYDKEIQFPKHAYTKEGILKEVEIAYFPKTKSLGLQGHSEGYGAPKELVKYMNKLIKELLFPEKILALNN